MKKVLVLLLVLAFGATLVSAEGVTFGAWTRTIYNIAQGDLSGVTKASQSMGPNWWAEGVGGQGLYASLSLNFQGPVLGYHVGWETDGGQLNTVPGHFLNFNVSVNVIADMLTLTLGKISNDQFRIWKDATDDPNGDRDWHIGRFEVSGRTNASNLADPGSGLVAAQVVFAPKDSGLAIGIYMPFAQNASSTFENNVDNLFAAASYNIASVGKIYVGTTPKQGSNGNEGISGTGITRDIYLGFDLTAVKGFDAVVAAQYNMNRNDSTGKSDGIELNVGASLNIDVFSMGVAFFMGQPLATATGTKSFIGIDVNPSLNLGAVSFGVTGTMNLYSYVGGAAVGVATLDYSVYPWVSINPISTKIGFKIVGDNSTPVTAGTNTTWYIPISVDLGF